MHKLVGLVLGATSIIAAPVSAAAPPRAAPSAPATAAAPLDPASLALARQVITVMFPPEKRSQMYASIIDGVMTQTRKNVQSKMATGDKDFDAILDRSMQRMYDQMKATVDDAIPDYFDAFARAYARDFSHDELEAILAFAKTPTGQRFFERSPLIINDPDVQAASQRMQEKLLAKLPELQRQTIKEIDDYVAKQAKQGKPASTPVS